MIVGDLNTLSSRDQKAHQKAALPAVIRRGAYAKALSKKFLDKRGAQVDYAPMQTLLDAGLHDVGAGSGNSVPTDINADHMHFAQLRLDYCLVNARLLSACGQKHKPRARILRTNETTRLSDHFPLAVTFGVPAAGGHAAQNEDAHHHGGGNGKPRRARRGRQETG